MAVESGSPVCPDTARVPLTTAPAHPPCTAPPLPDGPCPVCPRLAVAFEPWRQALLKQEIEQLRAHLRLRAQQLFGRKTEAGATAALTPPATDPAATPRRRRGQQPGRPGPRRRDQSHLPAVVEEHELPAEQCRFRR